MSGAGAPPVRCCVAPTVDAESELKTPALGGGWSRGDDARELRLSRQRRPSSRELIVQSLRGAVTSGSSSRTVTSSTRRRRRFSLDLRGADGRLGTRAEGVRRSRAPTIFPSRDDENYLRHTMMRGRMSGRARLEAGDHDEGWDPGAQVLRWKHGSLRSSAAAPLLPASACAEGVRGRRPHDTVDVHIRLATRTLAYCKNSCRILWLSPHARCGALACKTCMVDIAELNYSCC